jgi:hypothetical protein
MCLLSVELDIFLSTTCTPGDVLLSGDLAETKQVRKTSRWEVVSRTYQPLAQAQAVVSESGDCDVLHSS